MPNFTDFNMKAESDNGLITEMIERGNHAIFIGDVTSKIEKMLTSELGPDALNFIRVGGVTKTLGKLSNSTKARATLLNAKTGEPLSIAVRWVRVECTMSWNLLEKGAEQVWFVRSGRKWPPLRVRPLDAARILDDELSK